MDILLPITTKYSPTTKKDWLTSGLKNLMVCGEDNKS